jgi:hypothetical protein
MKKEYKDFYRFLWKYLEEGNSAIVIKPRQVGMTTFAARYAAWCLDYKDVGVHLHMCRRQNLKYMHQLIDDSRAINPYSRCRDLLKNMDRILPCEGCDIFHIFDEFDFMTNIDIKLRGCSLNHFLAYTTINNLKNLNSLRVPSVGAKEVRVFNISDYSENIHGMGY